MIRLPHIGTAALLAALVAAPLAAQEAPRTHAERTGWAELTPHEAVVDFYRELAAASPEVRMERIGTSREGRPMHLVSLSRPAVQGAWEAHASGKPILLIGAQVHGDEPAGKEGLMMFARDLVHGDLRHLLDQVVFLFIPQMNPDGAEAGEWGMRANSAGYNINRDYLRVDNPETEAIVSAMTTWRPHVVVDAHELPGPPRIYDFYTWFPTASNGPRAPVDLSRELLVPPIVEALEGAGYSHIVYHTPGGVAEDPASGIAVPVYGRTMNDYAAAQGMATILFESLRERDARVDIEDRARRHHIAMRALAQAVAANGDRVRTAIASGHREMATGGSGRIAGDSIAVRVEPVASKEIDYRVAAMERVETEAGARWQPTGEILDLRVPLVDSAVVTLARTRPAGYLIEPHRHDLADHLLSHGVRVERLVSQAAVQVESFRVDVATTDERPYEGYVPQRLETSLEARTLQVAASAFLVPADQPGAGLLFHLMEPESENAYATKGRFLAEARSGRHLPVHRITDWPAVATERLLPGAARQNATSNNGS
jgi:dipeptidyl-peptidase 4